MLGLEHDFRVVDVHVRFDPTDDGTGYRADPERLERELRAAGVVRAVVFAGAEYAAADGYLAANNAVARHAVERPFVPFARLRGARDVETRPGARLRNLAGGRDDADTAPEDVERYAYGDRFAGFVVAPASDGLPDAAVLDALADAGLPVLVGCSRAFPPAAVEEHLSALPAVLTGDGRPLDPDLASQAVAALDADDRYLDASAVRDRATLERAVRERPDRVLFGSSAPTVHPNVAVMAVLTLDVPRDALGRVFDRNPARVVAPLAGGERE